MTDEQKLMIIFKKIFDSIWELKETEEELEQDLVDWLTTLAGTSSESMQAMMDGDVEMAMNGLRVQALQAITAVMQLTDFKEGYMPEGFHDFVAKVTVGNVIDSEIVGVHIENLTLH